MDIVKIQAEVINEAVNGYRAAWYEEGDDVYVTIDRTSIFRIPKEQYFLDLRKEQVQGIGRALKEFEYGEKQEAVFTNDMKNLKQVGTAIRLKTENYDVWLAEKQLKQFGRLKFLKIIAMGTFKPVGIYDKLNNFLGLLSPVRATEVKKEN